MAKGAKRSKREGARKERAGPPAWSDDDILAQADIHAIQIEQSLIRQVKATPLEIAVTGAQLVARGMHREHRPCNDLDCECCRALEPMSGEQFRKIAHDMLDFFLTRAALALDAAEGSC